MHLWDTGTWESSATLTALKGYAPSVHAVWNPSLPLIVTNGQKESDLLVWCPEQSRLLQTVPSPQVANSQQNREDTATILQRKIAQRDFDVFLCHNGQDKAAVKQIGERLKERGILPWLDVWELRPGLPWQQLLENQIAQIKAAAVFVGKDGIGPWQRQELDAFLREFVQRGCPVIPVLLADAPQEPALPIFLRAMTWVDFRRQNPDPFDN